MTSATASKAAKLLRSAGRNKTPDSARLLKAQADEREWKAKHARLRHEIDSGKYVLRSEIEEQVLNHDIASADFYKRWTLNLEHDWPDRLVGLTAKEMKAVIARLARDHLNRMAKLTP